MRVHVAGNELLFFGGESRRWQAVEDLIQDGLGPALDPRRHPRVCHGQAKASDCVAGQRRFRLGVAQFRYRTFCVTPESAQKLNYSFLFDILNLIL